MHSTLKQQLFVIALSVSFSLPLILWILGFRPADIENVSRTELPPASFSRLWNGSYFSQLGDYIVDNNMLRPDGVRLNSLIEKNLFGQSAVKRVGLGASGWLFYTPASQVSCRDQEKLRATLTSLRTVNELLVAADKQLVLGVAPNKRSIYPEYERQPAGFSTECADGLRKLISSTFQQLGSDHFIDVQALLKLQRRARPDIALYTALDTHWTSYASAQFVAALLERVAPEVLQSASLQQVESTLAVGDLSKMLGDPKVQALEQYQFFAESVVKVLRFSGDKISGGRAPQLFRSFAENTAPSQRRVLVLHDSFGDSLCNQLPRVFSSVMFVHWDAFSAEAIADFIRTADILVLETVERDALTRLSTKIGSKEFIEALAFGIGSSDPDPKADTWWRPTVDANALQGNEVTGANRCQG